MLVSEINFSLFHGQKKFYHLIDVLKKIQKLKLIVLVNYNE